MRIVLGDSQALVRAGLCCLLRQYAQAEVVGQAADGRELLALSERLRPDVVLTDLDLPTMTGLEALTQLRQLHPQMPVLVVSALTDAQHVRSALSAGAAGFVVKDADPAELPLALQAIERGQVYLSPAISHKAVARRGADRRGGGRGDDLTPRQREVLQLIARGKSTRDISAEMGVSIKTVETHRARLMRSLDLSGNNALMRYAIRVGLDLV